MNEDKQIVGYLNIEASDEKVRELTGGGGALAIARGEILKIELQYGRSSERPAVSLTIGAILVATGLLPVKGIIGWMTDGGTIHFVHVAMLALVVLGAWVIFGVFRKNYFLRVETPSNSWNLVFRGDVSKEHLREFVEQANAEHGYGIVSEI